MCIFRINFRSAKHFALAYPEYQLIIYLFMLSLNPEANLNEI